MADLADQRREQMFPKLTPAQLARLEPQGRREATRPGEVLVEAGERYRELQVVLSGSLEIVLPGLDGEQVLTLLTAGDFSGELSTLRGAGGLVRIRVAEGGEILALAPEALRNVVQRDAELSEILMRAFILRRMRMLSLGESELVLLGARHSAETLRLREFLTRNAYPHTSLDVDSDACAQELLERYGVSAGEIPVVIGHCGKVFRNPGIAQIVDYLKMNPALDEAAVHDLAVVGAGPAGLAAAVYAASEGLDVLVLEAEAFGGQAGTSSKIENYLGFPTGISGQALAGRAFVQAQKFGAVVGVACRVERLRCERTPYALQLSDGRVIQARSVVIATGAKYREPQLDNLARFAGAGVYHAATHLESRLCEGEEAAVVGGGNSAGQAAVHLASTCTHVHILVRGEGLADSMSRYLVRRIEDTPNITLHTRTRITALEGDGHLERIRLRGPAGEETREIGHVFLMTGAEPNTRWLHDCVALDDKGFVRTGPDAAGWPLARAPHLLETSVPGVFAVGDVRSGNVKRVASAVGEGSICIQLVHRVLAHDPAIAATP
jgi:thioredoxin reductase (NADPH)